MFLDRLYTNMMSTLAVGCIRYGVMCRPDGMVFDDGTVSRLAEDRFLVTTTTGNAAAVLDWMEEWLQTEWPELRVQLHLGHRAVGHGRRWSARAPADVLGRARPRPRRRRRRLPVHDLAGRRRRRADRRGSVRISFSGELAYEINVSCRGTGWRCGRRARRGRPPTGSRRTAPRRCTCCAPRRGTRSSARTPTARSPRTTSASAGRCRRRRPTSSASARSAAPDTSRPDRKQLVGLLPDDAGRCCPRARHLVATPVLPRPPVPMLGHVTSSYRSAALGRTFALALVRGGRDRIGERLCAPTRRPTWCRSTVTGSVLYDPEGTRRDG